MSITDEQRATIDFDELGIPLPSGMNRSEILRFPTPGRVIGRIKVPERKRLLQRLYPEYEWLCSFAHGLPDAVFYKTAYDAESGTPMVGGQDPAEVFHRRVAEPAYLASLLSIVQAATELSTLYPHDVNLAASVTNAWKEISHGVLLGRAMWEIRSKSALGVIG